MNNCNIINDLIPLYVDGVCSEESKQWVESHIEACDKCQKNLQFMHKDMEVPEDHEATVLKQIKRRIRIEKMVVSGVVVFVLLISAFLGMLNLVTTQEAMNELIEEEEVRMEEDAEGNVWLIRSGMAVNADFVMRDIYTTDGDVIFEFENAENGMANVPENTKVIIKPVLCEDLFSLIVHKLMGNTSVDTMEERHILFNAKEKAHYEQVTFEYGDGEKVLWERE